MLWIKQSTAVVVNFGPATDKTDGVTLESGLVTAIDHVTTGLLLSKNGGAKAVRNGTPTASVYDSGDYRVTLNTTDTNTLGHLRLSYYDAATLVPLWAEFMVVPAVVYDAIIAGSDNLDVNVVQWLGTACATPTVAGVPEVDLTHVAGATTNVAALAINVDAILTDTADMQPKLGTPAGASISADLVVIDNFVDGIEATLAAGVVLADASSDAVIADAVWNAATATYGAAGSYGLLVETDLDAAISSRASQTSVDTIDGFLDTEIAAILADTNELQTDWANGGRLDLILDAASAPSAAAVADAVWDEALAGHLGVGSTGEALNAAGAAGDPWTTALPGAYGAGSAGKIVGDNINATISSRASQTTLDAVDDLLDTEIAAIKSDTAAILIDTAEIGAAGAGLTALASAAALTVVDDFLDTEIAAIKAKTDSLTFTVASQLDVNVLAVSSDTDSVTRLERVLSGNVTGTVGAASTTTSIVTSAMDPAAAVTDQFKGRIVTFDAATTTANLRGQSTDITASTAAGVLTVTALTTAPVSGDTFTVS